MKRTLSGAWAGVVCLLCAASLAAQQADFGQASPNLAYSFSSSIKVPRLVKLSGLLKDLTGRPLAGPVEVNFAIYKEQADAVPLWQEAQTLALDEQGRYTVLLGATQGEGLPMELFATGGARWLGIQAQGAEAQPRVLLVSVPYALKAGDAETLAGKPLSDFVLAQQLKEQVQTAVAQQAKKQPDRGQQALAMVLSQGPTPMATSQGQTSFTCPSGTSGDCVTVTQSSTGRALYAVGNSTAEALRVTQNGTGYGLLAMAASAAVYGVSTATTGSVYAIRGESASTGGRGILGLATATTGGTIGLWGNAASTSGTGVLGDATATTGTTYGLRGRSYSSSGTGILAYTMATTGTTKGLWAEVYSVDGTAAVFQNTASGKLLSGLVGTGTEVFSVAGNGNLVSAGSLSGTQLISTVASGTPPLTVTSPTLVTDLNADLLDGLHATSFASQTGLTAEATARSAADGTLQANISTRVSKAGDSMSGTLNLPANGLVAGTNQLVLSGGNVGVGTAAPAQALDVKGNAVFGSQGIPAAGAILTLGSGLEGTNDVSVSGGAAWGNVVQPSVAVTGDTTDFAALYAWTGSNISAGVTLANQYGMYVDAPATTGGGSVTNAYGLYVLAPTIATHNYAAYIAGLLINADGTITFASGQTFPGTGSGTVTSVGSGTGLTGGPITTSGSLSVDNAVVAFQTDLSAGIATAESYTDSAVGSEASARAAGDTAAISTAVTASNAYTDTAAAAQTAALNTHKTSGDHDARYAQLARANTFQLLGTAIPQILGPVDNSSGVGGFNSNPLDLAASAYNTSGGGAAEAETFRWQAEPLGDNTETPSATLNLLFGSNTTPAETGLKINADGTINFAAAQTFPAGAAGLGTITGVTAGTGLTGGGISGNVTLNLDTSKVPTLAAAANVFSGSVSASSFSGNGSGLTGVSASGLAAGTYSNAYTFSNAANSFTGNGSGLTNLNASNVTSGTLPSSALSGTYSNAVTLSNTSNSFKGNGSGLTGVSASGLAAGTYSNAYTFNNAANSFTGNGSGLTNLNASNVTSGTLPSSALSGTYSNAVTLSNTSNSFKGNGSGLTGVSASGLAAGTYSNAYTFNNAANSFTAASVTAGSVSASNGVVGTSGTGNGVYGLGYDGVEGSANSTNYAFGVWGIAGTGSNSYAGVFNGNVSVFGTLSKTAGAFKIDHPLDPANKYLLHSFVESPDMKNVYDGITVLDAKGEAWVDLPEWFETLNSDFRYQLTAVGAPAPGLYIAEEISGNRFKIAGGKPGGKVSWQVTGIRQDAYAKAHRIQVEEEKPQAEKGFYLHPELFGQPKEKGIEWAHHAQQMRQLESARKLPEPAGSGVR